MRVRTEPEPCEDDTMMTDWDPWSPQATLVTFDDDGNPSGIPRSETPTDLTPAEWLKLRPRRHRDWGPLLEPDTLAPAELFDPRSRTRAAVREPNPESGRASPTLALRLLRMSSGWKERVTEKRFHAALQATKRESRHRTVLSAWLLETTLVELDRTLAEGAFTTRELAQALHTQELNRHPRIKLINSYAARRHLDRT